MVAGIFLNSVVIISLCRSRQRRKKLCYFMILVLSCVDLAVVTITHPVPSFIASTFYFSPGEINEAHKDSRVRISIGFVLYAMALLMVILIGLSTSVYFNGETIDSILTIVIDLSFLFFVFFPFVQTTKYL